MGKAERHGDILQDMLQKYDTEYPILSEDQFKGAIQHLCSAKNALSRSKGYTPEILVLGKSRPLPGNIGEEFHQRPNILQTAIHRKVFNSDNNCR